MYTAQYLPLRLNLLRPSERSVKGECLVEGKVERVFICYKLFLSAESFA